MTDFTSWIFSIITLGFVIYWAISYSIIKFSSRIELGAGVLEFLRIWLKPLFFINFSWFILVELVFSIIFWTPYILLEVIALFYPFVRLLNYLKPEDPSIILWIFYSILMYCIVMIPYFILEYNLSHYFKREIFKRLSVEFKAKEAVFHRQSSSPEINQKLFTQIAANNETALSWIKKSFEEFSNSPGKEEKRFSIKMVSTDHMSWKLNDYKAHFFESVIEFDGQQKYIDDEGKERYNNEKTINLFNGTAVLIEDAFESPWPPVLFKVEKNKIENKLIIRKKHKQNLFIQIFHQTVFKSVATNKLTDYKNSNIKQYVVPEILQNENCSIYKYIYCDGNKIYLFLQTNLDNTAFDLNMNISVKENTELFRQDLTLVETAIQTIKPVLKYLEEIKTKNNINSIQGID